MRLIISLLLMLSMVLPGFASFSSDIKESGLNLAWEQYHYTGEDGNSYTATVYKDSKDYAETQERERYFYHFCFPLALGILGFVNLDWYGLLAGSCFIVYAMEYRF